MMIVIRVDLHHAVKGGITRLFTMTISNTGDHPQRPDRGNYVIRLGRKGQTGIKAVHASPLRTARVENYPRQSYHVGRLVLRSLKALFPEERS
jgi:hypothetical protein